METLANLESFVRSAETGSFSTAARRLSLSPAAVSRTSRRWSEISASGFSTAARESLR
jgi:DNA-binding transcriptional LysR family regulator